MKRVRVRHASGTIITVDALDRAPAPGLLIARDPDSEAWAVIHERSGYMVGGHENLEAVVAIGLALAPLTDWTCSAEDLVADSALSDAIRDVVTGRGGEFGPEAHPVEDLP